MTMDAKLRYEFFTPYHRGFDLVWDFLAAQPAATFSDGVLTAKGSLGYERARDLNLFADEQQIGHHRELWERFAPLAPVFEQFWHTFETAATRWQQERVEAKARGAEERRWQDAALCAKVLAKSSSLNGQSPTEEME